MTLDEKGIRELREIGKELGLKVWDKDKETLLKMIKEAQEENKDTSEEQALASLNITAIPEPINETETINFTVSTDEIDTEPVETETEVLETEESVIDVEPVVPRDTLEEVDVTFPGRCPTCGYKVKDQKALDDHRNESHATPLVVEEPEEEVVELKELDESDIVSMLKEIGYGNLRWNEGQRNQNHKTFAQALIKILERLESLESKF